MIVCRHTMELKEGFAFTQFTRLLGGMKTESEAFNKAFSIYAEGGLDVFRLLTPQYMEHLVSLPDHIRGIADTIDSLELPIQREA